MARRGSRLGSLYISACRPVRWPETPANQARNPTCEFLAWQLADRRQHGLQSRRFVARNSDLNPTRHQHFDPRRGPGGLTGVFQRQEFQGKRGALFIAGCRRGPYRRLAAERLSAVSGRKLASNTCSRWQNWPTVSRCRSNRASLSRRTSRLPRHIMVKMS